LAASEQIVLVIQVNGKVRDRLTVSVGISEGECRELALASPIVKKILEGKPPKKVIVVPGKLISIVI
jgi:leucyl-tRNA synthetase